MKLDGELFIAIGPQSQILVLQNTCWDGWLCAIHPPDLHWLTLLFELGCWVLVGFWTLESTFPWKEFQVPSPAVILGPMCLFRCPVPELVSVFRHLMGLTLATCSCLQCLTPAIWPVFNTNEPLTPSTHSQPWSWITCLDQLACLLFLISSGKHLAPRLTFRLIYASYWPDLILPPEQWATPLTSTQNSGHWVSLLSSMKVHANPLIAITMGFGLTFGQPGTLYPWHFVAFVLGSTQPWEWQQDVLHLWICLPINTSLSWSLLAAFLHQTSIK